ncbi:MAG: hypothetical protein M3071_04425 [Actinomycetota bacterium]|nr:hypothetical protein [Actinomycetota bacterium]
MSSELPTHRSSDTRRVPLVSLGCGLVASRRSRVAVDCCPLAVDGSLLTIPGTAVGL